MYEKNISMKNYFHYLYINIIKIYWTIVTTIVLYKIIGIYYNYIVIIAFKVIIISKICIPKKLVWNFIINF